jgi:hypothetical protein
VKLKYIIGVLALLLLTVSTASAAVVNYDITTDNLGKPISITVTYDQSTGLLTYTDNNYIASQQGILVAGYNCAFGPISGSLTTDPSSNNWYFGGGNTGFDGYGIFNSQYGSDASNVYKSVEIQLPPGTTLNANTKGYTVGVHYKWSDGLTGMGGGKESTTSIPEFPTIALPVAAIIGIMFIVGRKKE